MSEQRIRALVIAESCNPEWESIPLVGWSHANALRAHADVHIVTRSWNADALTRAGLIEGKDFTAINTEALFRPMERLVRRISGPNKGWALLTALSIPSYLYLEHLAWRIHGADLRAGRYDLVHRITPLSPAIPSLITTRLRRAGVPYILGPLNGGLPWPPDFPGLRRRDGEFLYALRQAYKMLPLYGSTRRNAAAILVGAQWVLNELPPQYHRKSVYVPENGIELARFPDPKARLPQSYLGRKLHAVWLGRMVPAKGADIALEAIAPLLLSGRMTLSLIGFGPEQTELEALTARLGVQEMVRFVGKISHFDVATHFRAADLLVFPSVHEFGGAVVLEAMAMGVVPVVVGYGGPAELVSPATGIQIPLAPRAQLIVAFRKALEEITAAPEQLAATSERAMARARSRFAWEAKALQTLEVYRWVLGRRPDRPNDKIPFPDPPDTVMEADPFGPPM
jgi:glycosyltransferase involved in cell wall biosynthesis